VDDDAGFDAAVVMKTEEASPLVDGKTVRMLALCRLKPPYHTESNTFWKATFAEPVDYTLRKRYLVGDLPRGVVLRQRQRQGAGQGSAALRLP